MTFRIFLYLTLCACVLAFDVFAELPHSDETLKRAFNSSGFVYHGQIRDFRPTDVPVHNDDGTTIIGLPQGGNWLHKFNGMIWHLETGELDFILPPAIDDRVVRWRTFGDTNAKGQIACTTRWSDEAGETRHTAFVVSDDHVPMVIEHANYPYTYTSAVNDHGQVVGIHREVKGRGNTWPYVWSEASGLQTLPTPKGAYAQVSDINNQGIIVGGLWGGVTRAAVWLPTDEPDEPYQLLELKPSEDCAESLAVQVNRHGLVLLHSNLSNFKRRVDENDPLVVRMQPYKWSVTDGYTIVEVPDQESAWPIGIDDQGGVLLRIHKNQPNRSPNQDYSYYLQRAGECKQLPDYPDAERTDYLFISGQGLIIGYARFNAISEQNQVTERASTFVISLTDQP